LGVAKLQQGFVATSSKQTKQKLGENMKHLNLQLERLEQRIAPGGFSYSGGSKGGSGGSKSGGSKAGGGTAHGSKAGGAKCGGSKG